MTMKLKYLPLCILLVGLAACSSKDNHESESNQAEETQTQENIVSLDAINEKSAIIVAKDKLSADQSWQQAESKVLFEPYRVCRRVNILRDYPDDKTKLYPRN